MILIIDFGSQYNQLIARRVRESRVYCQIVAPDITVDEIKNLNPEGIILSGGPSSIYEKTSPKVDTAIFDLNIPILGICYGMQYMVDALGGNVKKAAKREYGFATLNIVKPSDLFHKVEKQTQCWMSHGDSIQKLPAGFTIKASTSNTRVAATEHTPKKLYGLQFHPEVEHTSQGKKCSATFFLRYADVKKHGR